ncbi:snRNA-activating protein complex subunit 2 isoform X2 [Centroberyx gerrardi]
MKPPPRTRSKPDRYLKTEQILQHPRKRVCTWQRHEQQKLLAALKKLYKTAGSKGDIDYAFLKKIVPKRSISEIHSVVEALKTKVITSVNHQLMRQRREERRIKKPIELWTDMASVVTGTLEEPISIAFSQLLIVSSSEPRSLRNSIPHQVQRPTADQQKLVGRTMPHPAAQALHARIGQTSEYARSDNPRKFGVKSIVDFEKIYRYLSVVHKENEECALTPMESAIVLDLLMSLPEELPLLDCNKLHSHMIQVYSCLSAPANSKMAREMLKDEKPEKEGKDQHHITPLHNRDSLQTQTESGQDTGPNPDPDRNRMDSTSQGNAAGGGADNSVAMDSAGKTDEPGDGQAESNNTSRQPGDWEKVGLCPLNPFMMPLKLLMRKQKITDWR